MSLLNTSFVMSRSLSSRWPCPHAGQDTCRVVPDDAPCVQGPWRCGSACRMIYACRGTALAAELQPHRVRSAEGQAPQRDRPTENQPPRRGSHSRSAWLPEWQRVPGTSFVVDKFRSVQKVVCQHWFLSHFHADHYGGLSGRFCQGAVLVPRSSISGPVSHLASRMPLAALAVLKVACEGSGLLCGSI